MIYLWRKQPYIKLQILLPPNKWHDIDCLIDTGFSAGLSIPESFKKSFPANKFVEADFILADGSGVKVDTILTRVKFGDSEKEIIAAFMGKDDCLLGVEFLDQMRFCLDLKKYRVELTD
ncbi:hypothetical protein HYS11_00775 [Candidatus Gottesmanbacteria bacterium]|nr:hypothetical protein [Candidatus Gottesmanbacteria bacterium]